MDGADARSQAVESPADVHQAGG
ncbi:MAG: hypothetical protein JWM93_2061, partial [Frankiales bacterium]|nr:hypothetical protein [Frankiales bacterium]